MTTRHPLPTSADMDAYRTAKDLMGHSHTFTLTYRDSTDREQTFSTSDALWDGTRWNGFPAPQLPKWQAYLLDLLIADTSYDPSYPIPHPYLYSGDDEAEYVWMDGLTWTVEQTT